MWYLQIHKRTPKPQVLDSLKHNLLTVCTILRVAYINKQELLCCPSSSLHSDPHVALSIQRSQPQWLLWPYLWGTLLLLTWTVSLSYLYLHSPYRLWKTSTAVAYTVTSLCFDENMRFVLASWCPRFLCSPIESCLPPPLLRNQKNTRLAKDLRHRPRIHRRRTRSSHR